MTEKGPFFVIYLPYKVLIAPFRCHSGVKSKMENTNLNQYEKAAARVQAKVNSSRDGKWILVRLPDVEQPAILSVNFLKKVIETAEAKQAISSAVAKSIKE